MKEHLYVIGYVTSITPMQFSINNQLFHISLHGSPTWRLIHCCATSLPVVVEKSIPRSLEQFINAMWQQHVEMNHERKKNNVSMNEMLNPRNHHW